MDENSSTAVLTISCEEDNCNSCDADIDQLPVYLNEFGRSNSTCLLCCCTLPESFKPPNFSTIKVLKEVCIKSILPDVQVQAGVLDKSYPFCSECTEGKVTKLTNLYRQLQVLQEEFDDVRSKIVKEIIKSYVNNKETAAAAAAEQKKENDLNEIQNAIDKLFSYWKRYVGYPNLIEKPEEDDEDCFENVTVDDMSVLDYHVPLPIPTSPEQSDGEIRIKTEAVDPLESLENSPEGANEFQFDQTEQLQVLHLENQIQDAIAENSSDSSLSGEISPNSNSDSDNKSHHHTTTTDNRSKKSFTKRFFKDIPRSMIKRCQDDQLPVIYTTCDSTVETPKEIQPKRKLTRKLLLMKQRQGQIQRLKFVRSKKKGYSGRGGDSDSSSGSKSASEKRAKKATRQAIRTLVREPQRNENKIKLFTKHSHRHHSKKLSKKKNKFVKKEEEIKEEADSPPDPLAPSPPQSSDFDSDSQNHILQPTTNRGTKKKAKDGKSDDDSSNMTDSNNSSSDDSQLRRSRRSTKKPKNYLELLKCTPSIVEGKEKVQIPKYSAAGRASSSSTRKRPTRSRISEIFPKEESGGYMYPGLLPNDSPCESTDDSSDEPENPQPKRPRQARSRGRREIKKKAALDIESDDDSSDDYNPNPSQKRYIKKSEVQRQQMPKKVRKRPKKDEQTIAIQKSSKTPANKKRKNNSKPKKEEPGSRSPTQLGEDFDFTIPHDVKQFSDLLTHAVQSCVKKVDPSPSPSRSRNRSRSNQEAENENEADDGNISSNNDEADSSIKKTKKRKVSNSRKKEGPKQKRVDAPKMCSICGKILTSSYNLKLHLRTHTNEKPYECTHEGCGKKFYKPENLRTHSRHHTQERPYSCEVCNCKFSYRIVLRTHKASKHNIYDSEAIYECLPCDKKFIAECLLKKHFKICKRGGNEKNFAVFCTYCNLHFNNGDDFKEHQNKETHSSIRKIKMQEARKDSEENKKKTSLMGPQSEVECPHCKVKIADLRLLQIHINRSHTPAAILTCEICGKSFSSIGNLKSHQIIHTENKPFVCECGDKFNTKASLLSHKAKHEGNPPEFSCQHCQKGFKKEIVYKRHLYSKHKDLHVLLGPYTCKPCCISFISSANQTRHLLTQHRDSTCTVCGRLFACRSDMLKHLKRVHPLEPMPPRIRIAKEGDEESAQSAEDTEEEEETEDNAPRNYSMLPQNLLPNPQPQYPNLLHFGPQYPFAGNQEQRATDNYSNFYP